ncbi:helix-turn-helix domain-containing protein [Escherichia coli]|uniref:Helix-turn-helix domain-containing protein n=2 Tax=Enterobacteriaceae TaxID=543 RepID=A0AB33I4K7_ECOLX|nr:helix-turn-helix domain-containing protein [Escherichia coli]EFA8198146.1 helix-turn-helix domain-containing protein [Escherichia coli O111]EEQ2371430.1 helix-turn-helix domain-containing protein [Escherichia coli]EER1224643.1 helix-turn-helix domain-containing protein [Escherichia coli]EER2414401.1 helix-turn-helix domain-containing protein [Escherichia coli]
MDGSIDNQRDAWLVVIEAAKTALSQVESSNYRTVKQMALGSIIYAFEKLGFDFEATSILSEQHEKMNREDAAAYIGVEAQTLANWASTGKVRIPFLKIGRKVIYLKSDLDAYLASSKANTTK